MGLKGDVDEVVSVWRKASWPLRAWLLLSGFLAVSSIASLAEDIKNWKGFLKNGIEFYRALIVMPLRIYVLPLLGLHVPRATIDITIFYLFALASLIRSMYIVERTYSRLPFFPYNVAETQEYEDVAAAASARWRSAALNAVAARGLRQGATLSITLISIVWIVYMFLRWNNQPDGSPALLIDILGIAFLFCIPLYLFVVSAAVVVLRAILDGASWPPRAAVIVAAAKKRRDFLFPFIRKMVAIYYLQVSSVLIVVGILAAVSAGLRG
ncbi:hypothetical protein [Paraburkholderia flagellata]|uniref:hypothetical protein n=1 Tax=Paraburkholderia flagellata TaxID=2883241 RepID=UPI001F3898E7|nr:hypothetical protein [Paraburkholderia flagellata]